MGEINTTGSDTHQSKPKRKKLSTRVDLTPMVDLGFLLITFFIFSTTLSEPSEMKLILPNDTPVKDPMKTEASKTLTLIIHGNDTFSFFHGTDSLNTTMETNTEVSVRNIFIAKKKDLIAKFGKAEDLFVIIRPTDEASYASIVNVLDEIKINDIKRYVMLN